MKKYYSLCGKTICIDTEIFPADCSDWRLFEVGERSADVTVKCRCLGEFPVEIPDKNATEPTVFSKDGAVYRHFPMGTAQGALTRFKSGDFSETETFFTEQSHRTMMDYRYMWNSIALPQLLLPHGILLFHASYIEADGGAIIFSAPCGTGKSTQAALWEKYRNAEVINGDKTGVSVANGEVFANGLPFCGTSGICKNRSMPLKAIVLLGQSPENKIRRLNGAEAVQSLMENIYLDFLADGEAEKCVDVIIGILNKVPVFKLDCTPDERAVKILESAINSQYNA